MVVLVTAVEIIGVSRCGHERSQHQPDESAEKEDGGEQNGIRHLAFPFLNVATASRNKAAPNANAASAFVTRSPMMMISMASPS